MSDGSYEGDSGIRDPWILRHVGLFVFGTCAALFAAWFLLGVVASLVMWDWRPVVSLLPCIPIVLVLSACAALTEWLQRESEGDW